MRPVRHRDFPRGGLRSDGDNRHRAATILDANDAVVALNTALSRETVTIDDREGSVKIERPLHLVFVQDAGAPQAVFTRLR